MSLSANFGSLSISSNLALSKSMGNGHSDPWKLHMERFSSVTWPWSTWGRRGSCSSCQPTAGRGPEPARPEFVEISSRSWVILKFCFCGSYELLRTKLNLWHHDNLLVKYLLHCFETSVDVLHGDIEAGLCGKIEAGLWGKICIWSISTLSLSPQKVFRNSL